MKRRLVLIACIALAPFVAPFASAQPAPIIRGKVISIENGALTLASASGEKTTLRLPADPRVNVRVPATLADIKRDTYLGTTATPGPNGTLVASEVHIFPESRRGVGEGHSQMATMPGSTMTNATVRRIANPAPRSRTNGTVVAKAGAADHGRTLTLQYKGGEQTVYVSDTTPVVRTQQADRAALTRGAHVIVYAKRDADGSLIAERISVGANGSVPPI